MPTQTVGWGVENAQDTPHQMTFERRDLRDNDVAIAISHCGICHSDLHFAHDDWGMSHYPMIPGHEIVGTVTAVGPAVTHYKVGDRAAIGCMVDSCQQCEFCNESLEQFCVEGSTFTYGIPDRNGELTQGGYSTDIVCREEFVCRVPDSIDMAHAAPLLCAGITTYSPLRRFNAGPGMRVAVVGMGGLGDMAVKLAAAMGAEVTVVTTSPEKTDAAKKAGASDVLVSKDPAAMEAAAGRFHLILDTVPVGHDIDPYVALLRPFGTHVIVGAPEPLPGTNAGTLIFGNRSVAGTLIGGIAETQEMLDFCAQHGIVPDIEVITGDEISRAWDTLKKGDIAHRFVIDVANSAVAD
ncbi:NAD(P)-dependent alcohol dehydrogenase [Sphingomicrobium nitratireducens]|uniref:NAD(P)-dependent alcohol dehydrogenase n=1 Tax=Sphingomicrobium nitratireducens TaxID=2964666 RepID=UPI00223F9092|nr:NAD(P)-dependent alcohol dehydrogenase [Sphingomicrobium nitratireducens]